MTVDEVVKLTAMDYDSVLEAIKKGLRLPRSKKLLKLRSVHTRRGHQIKTEELDLFFRSFEKEEPGRHPPVAVRRTLLLECRHRCAICELDYPLQFHHITPWEDVKHHDPAEMMAICVRCHQRIHQGEIDVASQREYKSQLASRRLDSTEGGVKGSGSALTVKTAGSLFDLKFRGDHSKMSEQEKDRYLDTIAVVIGRDIREVKRKLRGISAGSIVFTLFLTPEEAEAIRSAEQAGVFEKLHLESFGKHRPKGQAMGRAGKDSVVRRKGSAEAGAGEMSRVDKELLKRLLENEQRFVDAPELHKVDAEEALYQAGASIPGPDATWYHPVVDDLSGRDRTVKAVQQVILTGAQEKALFHQFNFARYKIWTIQREVWAAPSRSATPEQARQILHWYRKSEQLREHIAEIHLALVLAMAKRTRMSEVDFADLVSEGNMALLRAVDEFNPARGYKFGTYACRAILKAFSRQGMKLSKYRQRFPTDFDPKLEKSNFLETKRATFEKDAAEEVKRIVLDNRADLTDVERTVMVYRFGLVSSDINKPMTLEEIGRIIGVTKASARQILNRAMEKVRIKLESEFLVTTGTDRPLVEIVTPSAREKEMARVTGPNSETNKTADQQLAERLGIALHAAFARGRMSRSSTRSAAEGLANEIAVALHKGPDFASWVNAALFGSFIKS